MIKPGFEEIYLFNLDEGYTLDALKTELARVCRATSSNIFSYGIEELQDGLFLLHFVSLSKFDGEMMIAVDDIIFYEYSKICHFHFTNNFHDRPGLFYVICVKAPVLYAGRSILLDAIDQCVRIVAVQHGLGRVFDSFSQGYGYLTYVIQLKKPLSDKVRVDLKSAINKVTSCPIVFERPIQVNQTWFERLADWLRWKSRGR